jgi:uncharacterized membrane protein (UPF0182 family)
LAELRDEQLRNRPLPEDSGAAFVPVWQRLLWAWRLRDLSLLRVQGGPVRNARIADRRILFHRSMEQCARQIVPFLVPGEQAYPVVTQTGLVWVLDLLSATRHFPLVPSTQREGALRGYNAARDSVKMTMDVETGQVSFYGTPQSENDPLLQPWRRVFPSLVKPWRAMPADLREQCRYPRALFEVQRDALQSAAGNAFSADTSAAVYSLWPTGEKYGESNSRFVLQGTLWHGAAPDAADVNEVAVLTADCDGDQYGTLRVLRFQERGPREAKTRTAPTNLLVNERLESSSRLEHERESAYRVLVPVGLSWPSSVEDLNSVATAQRLLWVEARYAPYEVARLNRVLVSDALNINDRPASGADLEQAWRRFWGQDESGQPRTITDLARQALSTHDLVQRAASAGDWAGFDIERKKLRAILLEMQARTEAQNVQQQNRQPLKR